MVHTFFFQIVIFLFGVTIGSFLNVLILRHERSRSVTGRSVCMRCGKQLTWLELIPIVSYVLQLGKCRGCGVKLSLQYPLVEFGTGLLFLVSASHLSGEHLTYFSYALLALHLVMWSLFMVITVYDLHTKLIPDEFSYTLAGCAFLALFLHDTGFVLPSLPHIFAGPVLFLPFYLLWEISDGRWLGLGDGKLALGIGWFLGLAQGATAVLYAFWIGAIVSLLIIGVQKVRNRGREGLTFKSEVPFGPFLVLGTLVVYVWGVDIFTLLLNM